MFECMEDESCIASSGEEMVLELDEMG